MPAKYYTRVVWVGKHFLWLLVGAMVLLIVWITSYNTGENGARIVFSHIPKSEALQNIMGKPHYQGVDSQQRPYTVTADKALQIDKDNVALDNIHADIMMKDNVWLALDALAGHMNLANKQLTLTGGIDMFYEGGYEFRTDHAQVDMSNNSAYGDAPVEVQGPAGTLTAVGFQANNAEQVITFNSQVKVTIYR